MYGAEKVVVILLDNGRSSASEECLWCIGCGNCVVHCPVYNAVGNEFGFNNYLGGRGVAMSKFIEDDKTCFESGLYMCTLCGLCTLNCPVSIPTNEIIENMRKLSTDVGFYPKAHGIIKDNVRDNDSPF
jgi:L-lactate dehydrogenase complex protein LldG